MLLKYFLKLETKNALCRFSSVYNRDSGSSVRSYSDEVQDVIFQFQSKLIKVNTNDQLLLAIKSFKKLRGCKFGIIQNQSLFENYLDDVQRVLTNRFQSQKPDQDKRQTVNELLEIKSLVKKWQGVQYLMEWLSRPLTQHLFVSSSQPLLMLQYFNILHQNDIKLDKFHGNIQNLVQHIAYKKLAQSADDRIDWFYGISILRQLSENERHQLKKGIKYIVGLQDSILVESKRFQETLGEYVGLCARQYYPTATSLKNILQDEKSIEDSDNEDILDDEMDELIGKAFIMLLNQDFLQYRRQFDELQFKPEGDKYDNIGLVDPMSWRTLSNLASGLQALASRGHINDQNSFYRLEKAIDRKLETDVAVINFSARITNILGRFSDADKNLISTLIQSIADQINLENPSRISINGSNIELVLQTLLKLKGMMGLQTQALVAPGINKLIQLIQEGLYDDELNKVDYFDLLELANAYKLENLSSYLKQKLEM